MTKNDMVKNENYALGKSYLRFMQEFLASTTRGELMLMSKARLWTLMGILTAVESELDEIFPDEAIRDYRDDFGRPLRGNRRPEYWKAQHKDCDEAAQVRRQREYLYRKTLPACRQKLLEMLCGRQFNEELHLRSGRIVNKISVFQEAILPFLEPIDPADLPE